MGFSFGNPDQTPASHSQRSRGSVGFSFASAAGSSMPVLPTSAFPDGHTGASDKDRIRRAILRVESGGDAWAVSPSGKHYGLYQMGDARAQDVGLPNGRVLLGKPELAEWAFWESLARSESVHQWVPDYVAISWKAGTGSLKKFLRDGADDRALRRIPWNTHVYVDRFRKAYAKEGQF